MRLRILLVLAVTTVMIILAAGCDSSGNDKTLKLHLLVNETYCKATACKCIHYLASREYEDVVASLKTGYNIDLKLTYCMEEDSIAMLLQTGTYDGVICKPWFALQLVPETGMQLKRIADVPDPFDGRLVHGVFIVKKESPVTKPEDLNGKTIALGRKDSFEKYHLAMRALDARSVEPAGFIQKESCTECINLLIDNKADAACISDYALYASCAVDFAPEDSFRVIMKTDSIPLCSVIVNLSRVNEADASRLQDALISLSATIPASFGSKGFMKPEPWEPVSYNSSGK